MEIWENCAILLVSISSPPPKCFGCNHNLHPHIIIVASFSLTEERGGEDAAVKQSPLLQLGTTSKWHPSLFQAALLVSGQFESNLTQPSLDWILIDNTRKSSSLLENQKEPESQLAVAKKLYMMQVQIIFSSSFKFRPIKIYIFAKGLNSNIWERKKKIHNSKSKLVSDFDCFIAFKLVVRGSSLVRWQKRARRELENYFAGTQTSSAAVIVGK